MREGMKVLVDTMEGFDLVWMAGTAGEAMSQLNHLVPDVLLVDITLPDRSGIELIKDIHVLHPDLRILVISMHEEKLYVQRSLRAGARGYITKDASHAEYERAIRRVAAGHVALSESMAEEIMLNFALGDSKPKSKSGIEALSDRELEVFMLLGEGKSTHEVASTLRISPKTVDVHKMNIRSKLAMSDPAELAYFAIRWVDRHAGN